LIINLYVAVDLAIALFTLAIGLFTASKAYRIDATEKVSTGDSRYESEKDYYLISTVGWLTLGTRILAIPLFYVTVISLIPSVPGAMCEFGVFQAGSPFSWADFGLKIFTLFAFGGWLFFDFINRKIKGAPLIGMLSRAFVLLLPLLVIDAILDIAFFGSLQPLVVPCCMVVYPLNSVFAGCPFCLITYKMPLLMGVIATYAVAVALVVWSLLFKKFASKSDVNHESNPVLSKALMVSIILAVIGTFLLIIQVKLGSFTPEFIYSL
jgi:hypothetical protein